MTLRLLVILFLFSTNAFAQENNWKLAKDKEGITIHTRKVEGVKLKEYRVELNVETPLPEVVSWIKDVENYSRWSFKLEDSKQRESDASSITFYAIQRTPWPAKDRDMCCRLEIKSESSSEFDAIITALPDHCPTNNDYIRVPSLKGSWQLKSLENGGTYIVQTVLTDPGGTIPDWMANAAVTDYPMKSFIKLKELLTN